MFLVLLISAFLLIFLHIIINHNERAKLMRKFPGPDFLFILGNTLEFLGTPANIFEKTRKYSNNWHRMFRIWGCNIACLNIYSPDDVETIISTTKHNVKSTLLYDFMRPWLRDGLLVSSGDKWQQRRKILTPAFHFNILRRFCTTIEENSHRMLETVSCSAGQTVDLVQLMTEFTLNSICETAMGVRFSDEMTDKGQGYKSAIHTIGAGLVQRVTAVFLHPDFIFNYSPLGRKQKKAVEMVQDFTKKVIKQRKAHIEEHGIKKIGNDDLDEYSMNAKGKKTAFLDLLLQAQKENSIDDYGIQEEVDTFMFEGHDTTACGLTYCLMLLANNKEVQDKIYDELYSIFGDSDRKLCYDDLSKMQYLECCIKESLRLYPPVPLIGRQINESITLGGLKTPKNMYCHILIFDLHRRPELFPDPLRFDPDRFLPENCVGRHPYAYIPFSAGPRNCIGQKFAMMEIKSAVAAILRRFVLEPVTHPDELQFISDLVLRTSNPVNVKFVKRK